MPGARHRFESITEGVWILNRRVVVTGLGWLLLWATQSRPPGPRFWKARVGQTYQEFDAERFAARFACEGKDFDPLDSSKEGSPQDGRLYPLRHRLRTRRYSLAD